MPEPAWLQQKCCSVSCSKKLTNPMHDEKNAAKVSKRLREIGHRPRVQGGNGRRLPRAQAQLLRALGRGWHPEFVVPCGMGCRTGGYPTHYKLDLANPVKRICIEVDGATHASPRIKAKDEKKTQRLTELGWSVYRVSNAKALSLSTTCTSPDTLLTSLKGS
jgi:hypothetical protein